MSSLTVRNVPDDAKHRFRQVAAAHGRSMEEHLRHLIVEADFGEAGAPPVGVADVQLEFTPAPTRADWVHELVRLADGAGEGVFDTGKYAEIRFMTAKDAMAELRRLANGAGLAPTPRLNTALEAPDF